MTLAVGSQLTPEWEESLLIEDMLTKREKALMAHVLSNREGALAWNFDHVY